MAVFDADTVSAHNVIRQRFAPQDVGHNKAVRLVSRINATYGWQWKAVPDRFPSPAAGELEADVLISCVDTRSARRDIQAALTKGCARRVAWWLDCGNDTDYGQVILGQPKNAANKGIQRRVPTAPEVYPELVRKGREDSAPSCSAEESLARQDLFVNAVVAGAACNLLWRLVKELHVVWHGQTVNLKDGIAQAFVIQPRP